MKLDLAKLSLACEFPIEPIAALFGDRRAVVFLVGPVNVELSPQEARILAANLNWAADSAEPPEEAYGKV